MFVYGPPETWYCCSLYSPLMGESIPVLTAPVEETLDSVTSPTKMWLIWQRASTPQDGALSEHCEYPYPHTECRFRQLARFCAMAICSEHCCHTKENVDSRPSNQAITGLGQHVVHALFMKADVTRKK